MLASHYIHDLSPFLFQFGEPGGDRWFDGQGIRWYGLAYIAGFAGAYFLVNWLAGKNRAELKKPLVLDFITMVALVGVLLGGRIGYMLFYNLDEFLSNPLSLFSITGGGMSSHGGFLGVALFAWWYARRHKLSWCGIGDDIAVSAPIGLFFGRIANFINGELWGRKTEVSWGMKFPEELTSREFVSADPALTSIELSAIPYAPGHFYTIMPAVKADPALLDIITRALPTRHPSQIYEAVLEGLLPFLILLFLRLKYRFGKGVLVGGFFVFYAVMRIFVENFREPDEGKSFIMGLTRGQFYSTFMIAAGAAFIAWGMTKGKRQGELTEA